MRLIDEPLTRQEKEHELDSIQGNICRISVSDDIEEVISSLGFAIDMLSLVAYSRIRELKERN